MLKFFRKLRFRLVKENHLSKYLLYAIGEIALVMIGILLALQVNTWNQNRKDRISEVGLLERLHEDLKADTVSWNWSLNLIDIKKDFLFAILKDETHLIPADKFQRLLFTSRFRNLPAPNNTTIQELTSNGKIELLHNKGLKKMILSYYNFIEERNIGLQSTFSDWPQLISELIPGILHYDARSDPNLKLSGEEITYISKKIHNNIAQIEPAINAELGFTGVQYRAYNSIKLRAEELLIRLTEELASHN